MGRYALDLLLFKWKGFKLYMTLSGFWKRKLELFAIHLVAPAPYKSVIYYYDFINGKQELFTA